jgi:phage baseplate assembly protein W
MAGTRANDLIKKPSGDIFSDFLDSFAKTPVGNQLARVVGPRSVNQALKNLIMTNLGERPFQPDIGTNVLATLFENNVPETLSTLEFYVQNAINNHEPRVNLIDVKAASTNNEHEISITIVYSLINNADPISFSFLLRRVR